MNIDDIQDRLKQAPGKANLFFYGNGVNIDIVAEWREGDQPMRRIIFSLPGALTCGGPLQ